MTTALTMYGTNTTATTINTAGLLVSVTGAAGSQTISTKCGTSTGFSEIFARGTANAWASGGSVGSPSGHGWLFDSTVLEGQTLLASSSWTLTTHVNINAGTATADMYINLYKYNGGVYTLIQQVLKSAQALTTTSTGYTFTFTPPATAFGVGDKFYHDVWFNLTANNSGSGTATIVWKASNSTTQGINGQETLATAGYAQTVLGGTMMLMGVG